MTSNRYPVALSSSHLEELRSSPLNGLIELIWNALDADASRVSVEFKLTESDGIEEIRVVDDGHGMTAEAAIDGFGQLGGSWKAAAERSRGGRVLHGKKGQGRFSAVGHGQRVRWISTGVGEDSRQQIELTVRESKPDELEVDERVVPSDSSQGTMVVLDGFTQPPLGLLGDGAVDRVVAEFAMYLTSCDASVFYNGETITPDELIAERSSFKLPDVAGNSVELTILEWNRKLRDRAFHLCDDNGFARAKVPLGMKAAGHEFSAYVRWAGFEDSGNLPLGDGLGSDHVLGLLDEARGKAREHFQMKDEAAEAEIVEKWKDDQVYPFADEPRSAVDEIEREIFDAVATRAADPINRGDPTSQRFSLRLLKEALARDPSSLQPILQEVLDLSATERHQLEELLRKTSLSAIIAASHKIASRLEFLEGLRHVIFDDDSKRATLERKELHKVLAEETWIFGEEYALLANDETLLTALRAHIKALGRDELVPSDAPEPGGSRRVVDLMLARVAEQARERREHLVVELKAPKVKLGDKQLSQITDYANRVSSDGRFDSVDVRWDFVLVGNEIAPHSSVEMLRTQENRELGLVVDQPNLKVWVKTWAEIIGATEHRMKFVKKSLDYAPSNQQALAYLKEQHAKNLPPEALASRT